MNNQLTPQTNVIFVTTAYFRTTKESTVKENGKCPELKTITKGDTVTMTSTVSLMSTTSSGSLVPGAVIDSSQDTTKIGDGKLIKGWRLGLLGACEGEERRIVLGPSLAWGARGVGDKIPGNSSVVIDVKVDKVERDLVFNFLNQISSGTFNNGK